MHLLIEVGSKGARKRTEKATGRYRGAWLHPERAGQSMIRLSKAVDAGLTTLSYHYAPRRFKAFFLGIEGGLAPRSIYVRYTYPDGQQSLDKAHFTGSFI